MRIRPRPCIAGALAGLVVALALPAGASAACPGIPEGRGTYIDFADGSVKFRDVFTKPGLAVSTNGKAIPRAFRAAGVGTAYFELHLEELVGLPTGPKPSAGIAAAADAEYAKAVDSTGCSTPLIALDEFEGGSATGPFSGGAATYRSNVIALLSRLRALGARPFLLIPSGFSISSRGAAQFWQQAASVAELIPEVYPNGRTIHGQGPLVGSRNLRIAYRSALTKLTYIGIPAQKLGLFIGFQSQIGNGGREGLKPTGAWLRVVKWMTIATETISREVGLGTVWSWGWGTFSAAGADADKPLAACVYLWTRNASLCPDAPSRAGTGFDASLKEGRLKVPGHKQCVWKGGGRIEAGDVTRLAAAIGGRPKALKTLLVAALARRAPGVKSKLISAAEQAIIKARFGGSRAAYIAKLRERGLSTRVAKALITDQVARRLLAARHEKSKSAQTYAQWLAGAQKSALATMTCRADEVPASGDENAAKRLSFLKLPRAKS